MALARHCDLRCAWTCGPDLLGDIVDRPSILRFKTLRIKLDTGTGILQMVRPRGPPGKAKPGNFPKSELRSPSRLKSEPLMKESYQRFGSGRVAVDQNPFDRALPAVDHKFIPDGDSNDFDPESLR
jgi:hypothetical protein